MGFGHMPATILNELQCRVLMEFELNANLSAFMSKVMTKGEDFFPVHAIIQQAPRKASFSKASVKSKYPLENQSALHYFRDDSRSSTTL